MMPSVSSHTGGRYGNTPIAETLRETHPRSVRALVCSNMEDCLPAYRQLVDGTWARRRSTALREHHVRVMVRDCASPTSLSCRDAVTTLQQVVSYHEGPATPAAGSVGTTRLLQAASDGMCSTGGQHPCCVNGLASSRAVICYRRLAAEQGPLRAAQRRPGLLGVPEAATAAGGAVQRGHDRGGCDRCRLIAMCKKCVGQVVLGGRACPSLPFSLECTKHPDD